MTRKVLAAAVALCLGIAARSDETASSESASASGPTHLLRYKFQPGEVLRWQVIHRAKVNTTVSGTTQTAETTTTSVKIWKVLPPDARGNARIEHSVEKVEMRQKLTGRDEVVYNSQTDAAPPLGFEDAAKAVGVPLSIITLDAQGGVIDRQQKHATATDQHGQVTIPLPAEAVPVGHAWSFPYDVQIPLRSGQVKQIKTRQHFRLSEVRDGVATIEMETQVLSPVNDPEVEAQLIQRETRGRAKFDIAAGRIVSQEMDLDKSVIGFSGESSSLHYVMRFSEELLPAAETAGPPLPPKRAASGAPPAKAQANPPTARLRR
jgi:hypothetical protein